MEKLIHSLEERSGKIGILIVVLTLDWSFTLPPAAKYRTWKPTPLPALTVWKTCWTAYLACATPTAT